LSPYLNHTDEELLTLLKQDNEGAFHTLFERYAGKVRSLAFSKVNSKEIAQEIVQEVFTYIWERRHDLQISSFSSYVFVAVKYQAINYFKSEITHQRHHKLYKAFIKISEESTMQSIQYNDLAEALEESVQKLSYKTQLVFRLNRFEGRSISEIALKLNLSEKAIKYHISRSLKELRVYLKEFLVSILLFLNF
jgi:RNA polymerase sigma-70 factor (ECF subfamily)